MRIKTAWLYCYIQNCTSKKKEIVIMMKFNVDGTLGSPFTAGGSIRGFSVSINQLDLLQKELKFVSLDQ